MLCFMWSEDALQFAVNEVLFEQEQFTTSGDKNWTGECEEMQWVSHLILF